LKGAHSDLTHGQASLLALKELEVPTSDVDVQRYLDVLPEESKKYFYSLIEALDIYQSIRGRALAVQGVTMSISEQVFHELRQIRDMCLYEGAKTLY
jgi:hypothetical protein